MLSSGHSKATALRTSQQLPLATQFLYHKIKQINTPEWREEEFMSPPPLDEELWVICSFWERKSRFPLKVWHLLGRLHSSGCPHTHEYMNNINWTWWIFKRNEKNMKLKGGVGVQEGSERSLREALG